MENITAAVKNKMALQYGVLIGLIYLVIATGVNVLIANYISYMAMKFIGYVLFFVIIGFFASQIKKANGGYMSFREMFGAIFIIILVSNLIYFIYSYVYYKFINPHFMDEMKTSILNFMMKMNVPDKSLEDTAQKMDLQIEESKKFDIGKTLMGYFGFIILDSLFGMLVSLIVRKEKPIFQQ